MRVWCMLQWDIVRILSMPCFWNKTQMWSWHSLIFRSTNGLHVSPWSQYHWGADYASILNRYEDSNEVFMLKWKQSFFKQQKSGFVALLYCWPQEASQKLILVSFRRYACLVRILAAKIRDVIGVLRNMRSTEKVRFSRCRKCLFLFRSKITHGSTPMLPRSVLIR